MCCIKSWSPFYCCYMPIVLDWILLLLLLLKQYFRWVLLLGFFFLRVTILFISRRFQIWFVDIFAPISTTSMALLGSDWYCYLRATFKPIRSCIIIYLFFSLSFRCFIWRTDKFLLYCICVFVVYCYLNIRTDNNEQKKNIQEYIPNSNKRCAIARNIVFVLHHHVYHLTRESNAETNTVDDFFTNT